MQTKFGKKWRPVFQIVDWVGGDGTAEARPKPELKMIPGTTNERALDDSIPY